MYLLICLLVLAFDNLTAHEEFHIWFERSGGFAGMSTSVELESKSLTPDEASEIGKLIQESGFFQYNLTDSISSGMPDQFQYNITIEYGNQKRSLELMEADIPEKFRPLIDYLMKKARTKRKRE